MYLAFDMESTDVELSQKIMEKDDPEKKKGDDNYLFIVLFYFLGTASYVPQSIYITANEYWMYKFRNPDLAFNQSDAVQKTTLQKNFTAYASFVISVGMIIFLFLTTGFLRKKVVIHKRIIGSMVSMLFLFAITLMFIYINTDSWQTGFFAIALGIGGLLSSCSSVLLVSLYELASQFPPRCFAAQFAGSSVCGILAAAIQILALLAGTSVKSTAALYYAITIGTIAVIILLYIVVLNKSKKFQTNVYDFEEKIEAISNNRPKITLSTVKNVLRKMRWLILSTILCLGCSATLHPGFTALIESSGKGTSTWSDKYFIPVCVFFLYNTIEFVGREVSNYFKVIRNIYLIVGTSVLRLVLIPLIILCNIQPKNNTSVIFHDDTYFIIFMILLAVSSGYLLNIILLVHGDFCEPNEKGLSRLIVLLLMLICVPIFSLLSGIFVNLI